MKTAVLLMLLAVAVPAAAQNVDIICRASTTAPLTVIDSQTQGVVTGVPYWNCNVPMPYIAPTGRWLCLTTVTAAMYSSGARLVGGSGAYVVVTHDIPGHDYHGFTVPPQVESQVAMAFPGGDALKVSIASALTSIVYTKVRVAGYLGRDSSYAREDACP